MATDPSPSPRDVIAEAETEPVELPRIADYEVIHVIGQGGMGRVYKARQIKLGRVVALKTILDQGTVRERNDFVSRFNREAKLLGSLEPHDGIVQVHDIVYGTDGRSYIVMEFVDGITLHSRMMDGIDFELREKLRTISEIARALSHAHESKIVHRDIKPENIMLTATGRVKIMDFGLARSLGATRLTSTGRILGTLWYMSPEQWRGDGLLDCRADIYSLGATLYQLVCGRTPFQDPEPHTLMYKHLYEHPILPSALGMDISENLETVILKALEKKPEDRFQSAAAFAEALDEIVSDYSIDSHTHEPHLAAGERQVVRVADGVSISFRWCPPGRFSMGSPELEEGRDTDEGPQTQVVLSRGFWMAETQTTLRAWSSFIEATGYVTEAESGDGAYGLTGGKWEKHSEYNWRSPGFQQDDQDQPVTCVSWNDAKEYLAWLERVTGRSMRLPTEAEWEYACRAGTATPFSFGRTASTAQANYNGNHVYGAGVREDSRQRTLPVGSFPPNAWGLSDMHGNVWEWCEDWWEGRLRGGVATNPRGPAVGTLRVTRGGSWCGAPHRMRSANRGRAAPDGRSDDLGIRLLMAPTRV